MTDDWLIENCVVYNFVYYFVHVLVGLTVQGMNSALSVSDCVM